MTELTPEEWRILWAFRIGVEHAERTFETMAKEIYRLEPQIGLKELQQRLDDKEKEEKRLDDKVLNDARVDES